MYALNLDGDGRILSATEDRYGAEGQPRAAELPTGGTAAEKDISNYKYIDSEYVYDPLPKPEPPEPVPGPEYATYDELAAAIKEGVDSYGE